MLKIIKNKQRQPLHWKRLPFIFLLSILSYYFPAKAQTPDKDISNSSFADWEPTLTVDPNDSNHLIAAWMQYRYYDTSFHITTKISNDGGNIWSNVNQFPHLYSDLTSADPTLAYDSKGNLYLAYLDYYSDWIDSTANDTGYVLVARSMDGGKTWSNPVKAIHWYDTPDVPIDRPWLAVDRSGGPYDGRIYLTSTTFAFLAYPHYTWLTYSDDQGQTWTPLKRIDIPIPGGQAKTQYAPPEVGPDGALYLSYNSFDTTLSPYFRYVCQKSIDGGNSFSTSIIANIDYDKAFQYIDYDTTLDQAYKISVNPADPSNVVFTFQYKPFGDVDMYAVISNDGGTTWSASPIRLNDDAAGNSVHQDMGWAGFSPDGTFAVVWRDRRESGTSVHSDFKIYGTLSRDKGNTFHSNFVLSSAPSPPFYVRGGNDFLGVALTDSYIFADWSDKRFDEDEIYLSKIDISSVSQIPPSSQKSPQNYNLLQCYPNPFNGSVKVRFFVQESGKIELEAFNVLGQRVKLLYKGKKVPGWYDVQWKAEDFAHKPVQSGIYFIRLQQGNLQTYSKVILLK